MESGQPGVEIGQCSNITSDSPRRPIRQPNAAFQTVRARHCVAALPKTLHAGGKGRAGPIRAAFVPWAPKGVKFLKRGVNEVLPAAMR